MKKTIVIFITILLSIFFVALVYYAIRYSRGIPTEIEKIKRPILEVGFVEKEIKLEEGLGDEIWAGLPAEEIKLMYQVMVLPWPKVVVPSVSVKAFRNQKDIYFYITWKDDTEDNVLRKNEFSDACAVMFPLAKEIQPTTIMMGFIGKANIWQWKASQDNEYWQNKHPQTEAYADYYYPFEDEETLPISKSIPKSAANDLLAIRVGTVTPIEEHNLESRGSYNNGSWQVVFKRPLAPLNPEEDVIFRIGEKQLCAFAAWNGSKGDRGGRKSISDWVELKIH